MIINNHATASKTAFRRGLYAYELKNLRHAENPITIIDLHFAVGKGEISAKDGALAQVKSAQRHLYDYKHTLHFLKENLLKISRPNGLGRKREILTSRDIQNITEGNPTTLAKASFGVATGQYDPRLAIGAIRHSGADREPVWSPIHHFMKRTQEMIPVSRTQKFFDKVGNVLYKSVSWIIE